MAKNIKKQSQKFSTEQFLESINNHTITVGVIGLGYVGLPIAVEYAKLGISEMSKKRSDYSNDVEYVYALMNHVLKTSKRPAYVGCGIDVNIFKAAGISDNMYLVGTAFRYSETKIDNLALIKRNFEQNYNLDYLFNEFQVHKEDEHVKQQINLTYIPGIMKLGNHYSLAGDEKKSDYFFGLFDHIAEMSEREEQIKSWYK